MPSCFLLGINDAGLRFCVKVHAGNFSLKICFSVLRLPTNTTKVNINIILYFCTWCASYAFWVPLLLFELVLLESDPLTGLGSGMLAAAAMKWNIYVCKRI